jgi:hypothetical protein
VVSAAQGVEALGAPGDEPAYIAQTLSPGAPPLEPSVLGAAAALQAFAVGETIPPATVNKPAEWWQPVYLHPVPDADYLFGCDVIDQRLCFDDAFSPAEKHLQNVQLVLEQAKAAHDLIASHIGAGFCPLLAAHDEVVHELWAFKLSVLTFRLKNIRLASRPRPDHWKKVLQESCLHFVDVVTSAADQDTAALTRSHQLRCRH